MAAPIRPAVRPALLAALLAACSSSGGAGPDAPEEDGSRSEDPACDASGPELPGNGKDDDCDGLRDELAVCATGGDHATIGEALAAVPRGGALELCAGTYPEGLALDDLPVTIRGAGVGQTILDAGGVGRAVATTGGADLGGVWLERLTLSGGVVGDLGGAARCSDGRLTLADVAIDGARADEGGGAVAADRCRLLVKDSRIAGATSAGPGGALRLSESDATIEASALLDNVGDDGGAIAALAGTLTLRDSTLAGNLASVRGGALYLEGDGEIAASTFTDNRASWTGGAIFVEGHAPTFTDNAIEANGALHEGGGLYLNHTAARLVGNTIADNVAEQDDGGGLRIFESAAVLEGNRIAGNTAGGDGGGAKLSHIAGRFVDNVIVGNVAAGHGGGLELDNDSSLVAGGAIEDNQAGGRGGGVHMSLAPWAGGRLDGIVVRGNRGHHGGGVAIEQNFQPVVVTGLVIEDNQADRGAGLYLAGADLIVEHTVVRGNLASDRGGGVEVAEPEPWTAECPCPPTETTQTLRFMVLHANQAGVGAALASDVGAALRLSSSILYGHDGGVRVDGPAPGWRYTDTFPATFSGMVDPTGVDGNLSVEPGFVSAAEGDYHLGGGSPCLDAGEPDARDLDGSRADQGRFGGEAGR